MIVNGVFEKRLAELVDLSKLVASALDSAGIPYRLVGGMAVFFHIDNVEPLAGRLTPDIDISIDRRQLAHVVKALEPAGLRFRQTDDAFVDAEQPRTKSAVHLIFSGEKVRPEYLEAVPAMSEPVRTTEGILLAPVADIIRMKLTSFRLKDKVHNQDLDSVGLITKEIEDSLSEPLRARLAEVRATE